MDIMAQLLGCLRAGLGSKITEVSLVLGGSKTTFEEIPLQSLTMDLNGKLLADVSDLL